MQLWKMSGSALLSGVAAGCVGQGPGTGCPGPLSPWSLCCIPVEGEGSPLLFFPEQTMIPLLGTAPMALLRRPPPHTKSYGKVCSLLSSAHPLLALSSHPPSRPREAMLKMSRADPNLARHI